MIIRHTSFDDVDQLMAIYAHAREEMKKNNNPHQWKNSSPKYEDVMNDILHRNSYVIIENDHICGVFALVFGADPTYSKIEGQWLNNNPYATIHRIASDNTKKGILHIVLDFAFKLISEVRIDTHKDNSIMRHLLEKEGFSYCGIIYLPNGEPRLAYHKSEAIYSERLMLRKVVKADDNSIYNGWAKYEIVTKYMTWLPHSDIEITRNVMKMWFEDYLKNQTVRFGICLRDGTLIGMIDIVDFVNGKNPEIGYVLSPVHWGKGYMTEACKTMVKYLFGLGYDKIIIGAHVDNKASNRVIEKVGFKFTHQETRPMSLIKPEIVTVNYYEITK